MRKIILTINQIDEIRKLYDNNIKDLEIAKETKTTLWAVKKTLKGYRRENNVCKSMSNSEIFVENSAYNRSNLRIKIIKENLICYKCAICGLDGYWNNNDLILQIDHINGISNDHRLENLRFLCYNCHSQTSTWGGANIKKETKETKEKKQYDIPKHENYSPTISFKQRKNPIWNIDKLELKDIVYKKQTFSEILDFFGFAKKGAQYQALKERLFWEKIDFTHIKLGYGSTKGKKFPRKPKYSLEEILIVNSPINNGQIKFRILDAGLLNYKCVKCGQIPEWNNKPLTLQLDHINGNRNDNRLENLRILCPNCHSQTDTFMGHNTLRYVQ